MVFDLPCYFLWSYKGIKTYIHEYGDVLSLVLIYNMIIYTILHISHKFLQITLCTESKCISNTFYIYSFFFNFCIFCCCSVAKSCLTLCDSRLQCFRLLCLSPSPCLPKFMSIASVIPYNHLILCCPLQTHWKRPWCWERLKAEREEGDRGHILHVTFYHVYFTWRI